MKIFSFPPIADAYSTVLILGTMPGIQSIRLNEYYGHPRNHFWKLVSSVFEEPFPADYDQKKAMLLRNRLALWDTLQACEREGSLDSAIVKEVPNDLASFLDNHPGIESLFFNGQKAAAFYKKYIGLTEKYTFVTLPSTSPANAGMTFENKLEHWKKIVL
ncbi:DNA-deoxyinosine glycosylase [Flavobacterium humi]|uniref:DNA-deoxyinosine glycosylase n=1 Tax=Flavobacterium humi TaxID=2562683 RepID=A0A4Z0LBY5_9FLAO|nr:DNA-deoxyinosine glycosylase [Flavobacterium humi]TGD59375.1 DNA-deoxyinosine glycosylase [Flavobacterium humi]